MSIEPQPIINLHESGTLAGVWDPDRLAQVVSNLAGNAVQYGTKDKPITVSLEGSYPAVVRLRIENYGSIPDKTRSTLFEPFKQVTHGKTGGLGLGLFITREIVRSHGGEILLETKNGRIRFEVILPHAAHPIETAMFSVNK